VDQNETEFDVLIPAMAIPRCIFLRNARQTLRFGGFCLAAVALLTGCATATSQPAPAPEPARTPVPAHPLAAKPSVQSGTQSNILAGPLSVEAAIERATRCSPQVIALRAAVEVAKQKKSAASDIPDPEAVVAWGKVDNDFEDTGDGNDNDGQRVGGRFYVPNPFIMTPKVNAGTANFRAEGASLEAAKWLVESDVRRLFAQIQYLAEDAALAMELAHQYELILQDERAREGQGVTTASEIVTAVQHEVEAHHNLDQARYRWQSARRELAGMLDLDLASTPMELATNTSGFHPSPGLAISFDQMQQIATEHRRDLVALHLRTLAAKSAYVEARNVKVPWLKDVGFTRRDSDGEWWVGIGVNVPLFSWTINNTDGVQQAELKLAEANEYNGTQTMQREIRDAMDEFDVQRRQQERDQKELAPLLSEMQRTLELLKQTPNVMPSQVAATEAQITESLRLKLESDWLYQSAEFNLERAVGVPLSIALNGN
jgi:outer membrane protein TolC